THCLPHHTARTYIYTLSLHDALPIFAADLDAIDLAAPELHVHVELDGEAAVGAPVLELVEIGDQRGGAVELHLAAVGAGDVEVRSEEHTSELQSRENLVCRLLLEKKK